MSNIKERDLTLRDKGYTEEHTKMWIDSVKGEKDEAIEYIEKQINECLPNNFKNLYIAYEPIWSIGTGKIPSAIEIQEMHSHI